MTKTDCKFKGIGISDGVASGKLCLFNRNIIHDTVNYITDTNAEIEKWINAVSRACEQLCELSELSRSMAGEGIASLFEAHVVMLGDIDFGDRVSELIIKEKMSAYSAIEKTAGEFYGMFAALDDEYLSARCMDVVDIAIRVLNILADKEVDYSHYGDDMIIVSDFLTPSEAAQLMFCGISGFILGVGDRYSHAAILARTLGIPAIIGVDSKDYARYPGHTVTINGTDGIITLSDI